MPLLCLVFIADHAASVKSCLYFDGDADIFGNPTDVCDNV